MNILIPCISNAPDRDHDAVVLVVTDELTETLRACRVAFDMRLLTDPGLYRHEYEGGPVNYLVTADFYDAPDSPTNFAGHMADFEMTGPWELEPVARPFLSVIKEGFYYTWDGEQNKHGPSEVYETENFTLEELMNV